MLTNEVLREVIVVDHDTTFNPAHYPWLTKAKVVIKSGDADGGHPGYVLLELYGPSDDTA